MTKEEINSEIENFDCLIIEMPINNLKPVYDGIIDIDKYYAAK